MDFWQRIDSKDAYNNVFKALDDNVSIQALKGLFPHGAESVDTRNFILFSTSGVHGTYNTIEDAERYKGEVTFLVVHPRIVSLRYGNVLPQTEDDFKFLKELRQASWDIVQHIGKD